MVFSLAPLAVTNLGYEELAELPVRLKYDIDNNIDKSKMTDVTLTDYLSDLYEKGTTFKNGLGKGGANDYTLKLFNADKLRDRAIAIFMQALRLAHEADDEAEVDAAESLLNMLKPFGNVQRKNFEAESAAIDAILVNLSEAKYKAHITKLGLAKYVAKIQQTNDDFKALFTTRVADKLKETPLDLKAVRKELIIIYNDTVEYILAMAKSKKHPNVELFKQLLTVVNAGRKYFNDNYIRRGK